MARFRKGQSMNDVEMVIVGDFKQKGGMNGRNLHMVVANDYNIDGSKKEPQDVITNPQMKSEFIEADGKKFKSVTTAVSAKQYDKIMENANTDGDYPKFRGAVMPEKNKDGKVVGVMPNTNKLGPKPVTGFDHALHKENTIEGTKYHKEQDAIAKAEAESAAATETETAATKEKDDALEL